ncbi:MAG: thio(seleno)oxazole modification radical SAM maturase SbtM [Candidatus Omnitrophica bacterium]|nr:thio(seleno)oxazole modification radical SAM maturase SbtM [Candidatus Omnitrophota bacterium]MDD5488602.1 thio(seleno)oxazole modification radical SAM maturase SbtM [Candidatus Omnitrophota bacterium]
MKRKIKRKDLAGIYSLSSSIVGEKEWERIIAHVPNTVDPGAFPEVVEGVADDINVPGFLPGLLVVERAKVDLSEMPDMEMPEVDRYELNPVLEVMHSTWKIAHLFSPHDQKHVYMPMPGEEWVLTWKDPKNGNVNVAPASKEELLAIKVIVEKIDPDKLAEVGENAEGTIENALRNAAAKGIMIAPRSRIRRDASLFPKDEGTIPSREYTDADVFTLQWHITHACDLNCMHCYDRSRREEISLAESHKILDDMKELCRVKRVRGHVCFTGGNPFMHPDFFEMYHSAVRRGLSTSILGNPVTREALKRLVAIHKPGYYQVSLEGLPEHNDKIRGKGNFHNVIEFLGILRDLRIPSAVMLTLTKDNMDQVLPLAERLRGHAEYFTYNRLSQVGSGAALELPGGEEYMEFVERFVKASESNPIIGFKDNLINVVLDRNEDELFGGCTGHGCGAAFNFLTVLPDGEVHACRKFPSLLGNVNGQRLGDIYDSSLAERYRMGPEACRGCRLRHVCGGCMAVTSGAGMDIFTQKDPHCPRGPAGYQK